MISSYAERLRSLLVSSNPKLRELEARYPLKRLADELDRHDPFSGYLAVPGAVSQVVSKIDLQYSERESSDYLYLLMAYYLDDFEGRFRRSGLPKDFENEFLSVFRRVIDSTGNSDLRLRASLDNDLFMKDFGIARQILIPCASHLVYRHAGVPRRLLFTLPRMRDRVSLLKTLLLDTHGFRPFMENHVHLPMLNEFNPDGRERCFGLVAELLRFIPESLGLIGTSWYYDPELSEVSPGLAYLHRVPAEKGAVFLDLGESEQARRDAAARSTRRRTLIEQGDYRPRLTMMIWSRRDILAHY